MVLKSKWIKIFHNYFKEQVLLSRIFQILKALSLFTHTIFFFSDALHEIGKAIFGGLAQAVHRVATPGLPNIGGKVAFQSVQLIHARIDILH